MLRFYFAIIVGILLIGAAIIDLVNRKRIIGNGGYTYAKVTKIRRSIWSKYGFTYYLMLRYKVRGTSYEQEISMGSRGKHHKAGDTMKIMYHRENPKKMFVEDGRNHVARTVLIILLAIGLTALGVFGVIYYS